MTNRETRARLVALAAEIVEALIGSEGQQDIDDATHGNYDARTLMIRIGDRWRRKVEAVLVRDSALSVEPSSPRNPERVRRLARSFAQEWQRPDNPEAATEILTVTLTTAMTAFYAAARSADERDRMALSVEPALPVSVERGRDED